MTKNPPLHEPHLPAAYYYAEDEINLVDLWLVLVRRRKVVFAVTAVCLIAGIALALILPRKYEYTTSIEIGSRASGTKVALIEPPETVLAKVQESYIPLVRQEYLSQHPEKTRAPKIEVSIPKNSQILVLRSKGPKANAEVYQSLQQAVVDRLTQDHGRIIALLRKDMENQQRKAEAKLAELKDAAILLKGREKRLADVTALLGKQVTEARADLKRAEGNRQEAIHEANNESKAMTLLMLDNEIRQYHQRLDKLDERLQIEVANNQDDLAKQLADNGRAQATQQDHISQLEGELANLRGTRAILAPMRSPEPSGAGPKLIAVLSLVLGIILGVFAAFFAEFIAKARLQMQASS
jgi:capsular polysaccharide biosynthesis protein